MVEKTQPESVQSGGGKVRAPSKGTVLLTAQQVAEQTGLSIETLAQWRSQKRGIPYVKISRNCVRYCQADLDSWLAARIVRTSQEGPEREGR